MTRSNCAKSQAAFQSTMLASTPAATRCGSTRRSLSAPFSRPAYVISAIFFVIVYGSMSSSAGGIRTMPISKPGFCSQPFQVSYRAFILQIAGVERRCRLKQHHMRLFQRVRHVLSAVRNNNKLARTDCVVMLLAAGIAPFHVQLALRHQEHFIFCVVMMPHEFTLHL